MSLQQELRITSDNFEYTITYIHGFPKEDQMTPRLAVTKLVERVEFALRRARSQIAQHWFRLCLNELALVLGNISDLAQVEKHLDAAKTYFEYGRTRKKWEAEYVVGPDGKVEQTKKL